MQRTLHTFRSIFPNGRREIEPCGNTLRYQPNRRTVIFLPGRDVAFGCDLMHIGSGIKCCERLFGGRNTYTLGHEKPELGINGIDVLATTYSEPIPDQTFERYFKDPEHFISHDARVFVNFVLMPLLNDDGRNSGFSYKYSLGELKERLSHITLIGHSYGGIFAQEVANELRSFLGRNGYSPSEIREAVQSVVSLAVANTALTDLKEPTFKTFTFTERNDQSAQKAIRHYISRTLPPLDPETASHADKVTYDGKVADLQAKTLRNCGYLPDYASYVVKPSGIGYIISDKTDLPEKHWEEVRVAPSGEEKVEKRSINKRSSEEMSMDLRHDLRYHVIPDIKHTAYPTTIRRVMRHAVLRGPDTPPSEAFLLKNVPSGIFPNPADFRPRKEYMRDELTERIQQGMRERSMTALGINQTGDDRAQGIA